MTYSTQTMMPVTLVEDLMKPPTVPYPYYPPAPAVSASSAAVQPTDVNTDLLHEVRQIKYIVSGLGVAIFFILLVLILKKN